MLLVGLSACTSKSAENYPTNDRPMQQAVAATQAPIIQTQTTEKVAAASISCDQLIPPDEASSLMTGLSPKMTEKSVQGRTTCIWQYTSKVSGQAADFQLEAGYNPSAVEDWTTARKSEVAGQPSDLNVISIDGLGDENYAWNAKPGNQMVVYVRRGSQTLIMHYQAADILFMGTESGIIDMADRVFGRMNH